MSIADKLTLLANSKEALRVKLKIPKSVPFSKYLDYVDWASAPSIPNKAFYADFTNDRYIKDGVPCVFKDLFTFTRAGKAWLVKDTGLQEYAADVPRLDNGLLIEQSATNAISYSSDITRWNLDGGVATKADSVGYTVTQTVAGRGIISTDTGVDSSKERILSSYIKKTQTDAYVTLGGRGIYTARVSATINTKTGAITRSADTTDVSVVSVGDYYLLRVRATNLGAPPQLRIAKTDGVASLTGVAGDYTTGTVMYLNGSVHSSFILTGAAPVTRPADFLLNKITGTAVTGDWDSTLTLSIVNGNLVHSGYGRIRSLEIN